MKAAEARDGHGQQGQELLHRPVHRQQAGGRARSRPSTSRTAPDPGFEQAINNYYASLDVAKALPASRAGAEIDAAWKSGVARALAGQPAQAALDQAQKEAQAAFDKAPARG